MQEKQRELFEQYPMELLQVRRGRGGVICKEGHHLYHMQMCQYSPKRLEQAFEIKEQLKGFGFPFVDQYIRNGEGNLLSYDYYQTPYILKEHFDGRECDIRNENDIYLAGQTLGNLHQQLQKCTIEGSSRKRSGFAEKTKELLRTKQHISHKNEKKEFEILFQKYFDLFYQDIRYIPEIGSYRPCLCHGSYHQHHLIRLPENKMAVIQWEQFYIGNQLDDLFHLMRKVLEKNEYKFGVAQILLQAYEEINALDIQQHKDLYAMLSYPEKYWKLANQYMNHRKSFLSPKLTEKLQEAVELSGKKKKFLQKYCSIYI